MNHDIFFYRVKSQEAMQYKLLGIPSRRGQNIARTPLQYDLIISFDANDSGYKSALVYFILNYR